MNKKVSLLTALLVSAGITTASADMLMGGCPKSFTGFHFGANIGYGDGWAKQKSEGAVVISNKLGVSGVDGGIGTGYTLGCGNWRFGIAFDANWASSSGKLNIADGDIIAKTRLKNSLQLYGKTGYVICDKVMPFVALGWENAKWSHNVTAGANTVSESKRHNALMWKAGVDFLMTKHIIAGLEYTGSIANRKSFDVTVGEGTATVSHKPQYNKIAATLRVIY